MLAVLTICGEVEKYLETFFKVILHLAVFGVILHLVIEPFSDWITVEYRMWSVLKSISA